MYPLTGMGGEGGGAILPLMPDEPVGIERLQQLLAQESNEQH